MLASLTLLASLLSQPPIYAQESTPETPEVRTQLGPSYKKFGTYFSFGGDPVYFYGINFFYQPYSSLRLTGGTSPYIPIPGFQLGVKWLPEFAQISSLRANTGINYYYASMNSVSAQALYLNLGLEWTSSPGLFIGLGMNAALIYSNGLPANAYLNVGYEWGETADTRIVTEIDDIKESLSSDFKVGLYGSHMGEPVGATFGLTLFYHLTPEWRVTVGAGYLRYYSHYAFSSAIVWSGSAPAGPTAYPPLWNLGVKWFPEFAHWKRFYFYTGINYCYVDYPGPSTVLASRFYGNLGVEYRFPFGVLLGLGMNIVTSQYNTIPVQLSPYSTIGFGF